MQYYASDEYPVSRKPVEEPGDWYCTQPRCPGRAGGPKPFVNFQKNRECKICGERKPPQPCSYWVHNGSCRRQEQHGDCKHTHLPDDKGSKYGENIPDYVIGKGGARDRPAWMAGQPWSLAEAERRAGLPVEKCRCGKDLSACGSCGGVAWPQADQGTPAPGQPDDSDPWRQWANVQKPAIIDPAEAQKAREALLERHLLTSKSVEQMVDRINENLPDRPSFTPVELHLALIQKQHAMQIQNAVHWVCDLFKRLPAERQNLVTALGKKLIHETGGAIGKAVETVVKLSDPLKNMEPATASASYSPTDEASPVIDSRNAPAVKAEREAADVAWQQRQQNAPAIKSPSPSEFSSPAAANQLSAPKATTETMQRLRQDIQTSPWSSLGRNPQAPEAFKSPFATGSNLFATPDKPPSSAAAGGISRKPAVGEFVNCHL